MFSWATEPPGHLVSSTHPYSFLQSLLDGHVGHLRPVQQICSYLLALSRAAGSGCAYLSAMDKAESDRSQTHQ